MTLNRRGFLTKSTLVASAPTLAMTTVAAQVLTAQEQGIQRAQSEPEKLKVLIGAISDQRYAELSEISPRLQLVRCANFQAALSEVHDAHASLGFINRELILAGKHLRWVQQSSAGVEQLMEIPELVESNIQLTNMQRVLGPEIADQTIGYLLAFTRGLSHFIRKNVEKTWPATSGAGTLDELPGKTMLVLGLGGIGFEIAKRAAAFDMKILATDAKVWQKPSFVAELHRPEALDSLLPQADVVVSALPLTPLTKNLLNAARFNLMKQGAYLINISRGGIVETDALVAALNSGKITAAGLDVTAPEPLPAGHPLWSQNVIITPHSAGVSPGYQLRANLVIRENLRRFAAGEQLINLVDKSVGY